MSRWDNIIARMDTLESRLGSATDSVEKTTYGEIINWGDEIEAALADAEKAVRHLHVQCSTLKKAKEEAA